MYAGKYHILGSTIGVKKPQKHLASLHQKCSSIILTDFGTKSFERTRFLNRAIEVHKSYEVYLSLL